MSDKQPIPEGAAMLATSASAPARLQSLSGVDAQKAPRAAPQTDAKIVAAVEAPTVRETAATAASLARDLRAPLTFVCVRPHASSILGELQVERRLSREPFRARGTLDVALAAAVGADVMAHGEIVVGDAIATGSDDVFLAV